MATTSEYFASIRAHSAAYAARQYNKAVAERDAIANERAAYRAKPVSELDYITLIELARSGNFDAMSELKARGSHPTR